MFHVYMLKKYQGNENYIIHWDSILLDYNIAHEEEQVAILAREVHKLRSKEIASVKIQWKNCPVEESAWEIEADMHKDIHTFLSIQVWQGDRVGLPRPATGSRTGSSDPVPYFLAGWAGIGIGDRLGAGSPLGPG
ncbi:hypothetical protein MTR67_038424 [Solanum verrucosum]|uniref:Chromo domain-containing protein n=1 Tax=Solanum verrucosum TaxID=315347 RepID=A0AAF0UFS4_SOLVR|nr:hypothetical protein MTR67_038424 [Solanum verrucosum]